MMHWRPATLAAAVLAMATGTTLAGPATGVAWPSLPLPEAARVERLGEGLRLNGAYARLERFEIEATDEAVLAHFRAVFGKRSVEQRVQGLPVIAARQGSHFHTVQLRRTTAHRIEGLVMTTHLEPPAAPSAWSRDTARLLPADSRVLSRLEADDGGRPSLLLTAANRHSLEANREHLLRTLAAEGLKLQREDGGHAGKPGLSLTLASAHEQAVVTVTQGARHGQRMVVVHRTKELAP